MRLCRPDCGHRQLPVLLIALLRFQFFFFRFFLHLVCDRKPQLVRDDARPVGLLFTVDVYWLERNYAGIWILRYLVDQFCFPPVLVVSFPSATASSVIWYSGFCAFTDWYNRVYPGSPVQSLFLFSWRLFSLLIWGSVRSVVSVDWEPDRSAHVVFTWFIV